MKKLFLLWVLGFSTCIGAKAPEIFRCLQKDGSVVIQDRLCMVTDLQQAKPQKRALAVQKIDLTQSKPVNNLPRRPDKVASTNGIQKSKRSPFFTFGWDHFIPTNWVMKKFKSAKYEQLMISRTLFKNKKDFRHGVKLSVYSNTMKASQLDAFAQALHLYHQIRDNSSLLLLDSQFKSDPSYKVFNIKYQNQSQQLLLTEFYIDEDNNDLFVVTVQAKEADWSLNLQMAETIISRF